MANMLYLESPAGSGSDSGFSVCEKSGKPVHCHWNDTSQAEAYGHTLAAFYKAFPEFQNNDLYLTGESYFGQYGPNIAKWILDQPDETVADVKIPLKGIALGNACWGGDATNVQCNGPNSQQNDAEMYYGKGLSSKELYVSLHPSQTHTKHFQTSQHSYDEIMETCKFPRVGLECEACWRNNPWKSDRTTCTTSTTTAQELEYLKQHNSTMRQLLSRTSISFQHTR